MPVHMRMAAAIAVALLILGGSVAAQEWQDPPTTGAFFGNFPQAFSHIGVIAAGVTLARETAST